MTDAIHAAGIIFENEQGQILVLRRHPQKPEGGLWGIAGGKLEAGEDSSVAAIREAKEEIGVAVNPADVQIIHRHARQDGTVKVFFDTYRLKVMAADITLAIDRREHTEHQWADPAVLYQQRDLMAGLYPILEDVYRLRRPKGVA